MNFRLSHFKVREFRSPSFLLIVFYTIGIVTLHIVQQYPVKLSDVDNFTFNGVFNVIILSISQYIVAFVS